MTSDSARDTSWRVLHEHERVQLEEFGALLRHARERSGMRQWQLALAAGYTTRYLQYLEAGQRRPRLSTLTELADVLSRALWSEDRSVDPEALVGFFLESVRDALAPETDHPEKRESRRKGRARRALTTGGQGQRLERTIKRRSAGEERRRLARVTRMAAMERAGYRAHPVG